MVLKRAVFVIIVLLLLFSLGSAACSPTPVPKSLRVYAALDEPTLTALVKTFKERTGIEVESVLLGAGQVTARVREEKDAPGADVFLGGSLELHDPPGREGLLLRYRSPEAKDIPQRYVDPDGYWHGWYLGILGIVLNPDRFTKAPAPKGVREPATWDDLVDPNWQGQFVIAGPAQTGGGFIFLVNQIFRLGEDRAWQYLRTLHKNVAGYTPDAYGPIRLVAADRFVAAVAWAHDILAAKKHGSSVKLIVPLDTAFEVGAVSIIQGGPNPVGAKRFVDFVLGQEAGQINVDAGLRISVRADVSAPPGGVSVGQVKLVEYYRKWAMENRDRLLRQWAYLGQKREVR